jgi:hypothetical protein
MTCLPFCTFISEEHKTSFPAMLDAEMERERRIRALVVLSLVDHHGLEVGAGANVTWILQTKMFICICEVQAIRFIFK